MRRARVAIAALSILLVALIAAGALLLGGHHGSYANEVVDRATHPGPAASLTDLRDVNQLRDAFNQDDGTPRLVLLFSPT